MIHISYAKVFMKFVSTTPSSGHECGLEVAVSQGKMGEFFETKRKFIWNLLEAPLLDITKFVSNFTEYTKRNYK